MNRIKTANYKYEDFLKKIRRSEAGKHVFSIFEYFRGKSKKSGWCLHHMDKTKTTHEIQNGKKPEYYESLSKRLDENDEQLLKQIDNCVLLPIWFHDYIHENNLDFYLTTIESLKNKMLQILNSEEVIKEIKKLRFQGKTIIQQLKSIQRLVNVSHLVSNKQITNLLQQVYRKVLRQMLDYFKKNKQ